MSLFQEAGPLENRLKLYLFGETGTGKTVTSLHFPNAFIFDTEKGTNYYNKFFKFKRIQSSDPVLLNQAIDELLDNPGDCKTFIIDQFTTIAEKISDNYLTKLKVKNANPNYTLQPKDYKPIKMAVKNLIDKLLSLDMNIIVTAKCSTLYSDNKDEFMKVVGTKADGPKELPYMFDIVLELKKNPEAKDKFIARVEKDRTNTLPQEFDFSYTTMAEYLGEEGLQRDPVVFRQKENLAQVNNRNTEVVFNGQKIKTAGVTAPSLTILSELVEKVGMEKVLEKLKDDYYVGSMLDLKDNEAQLLIKDLSDL